MHLGRRLGNYLGGKQPEIIYDIVDTGDIGTFNVHWNQNGRTESVEHIFVDRRRVAVKGQGLVRGEIFVEPLDRVVVEVLSAGPFNADEPEAVLIKFLEDAIRDKVVLRWDPPDPPNEATTFKIYGGTSLPLDLLDTISGSEVDYVTSVLTPGTWTFMVNPVDQVGNELASSMSVSVVVPSIVQPPEDPVTFVMTGPTTGTVTWVASPTPGIDFYNVYANGGSGFPDMTIPVATVGGASLSAAVPGLVEGDWIFIVRAEKGAEETDNFDKRADVKLVGAVPPLALVGPAANPVTLLSAGLLPGGFIRVFTRYEAFGEESLGVLIHLYLGTEAVPPDFSSPPTEVIAIPSHPLGEDLEFELEEDIGPLPEDDYIIVARVLSASGFEDSPGARITISTDLDPPNDLDALTAELT